MNDDPRGTPGPEPIGRIPPYLRANPSGATPAGSPSRQQPGQASLRPFVLTAGRVNAVDREIDLETQVTLRPYDPRAGRPPLASLGPEMQAIVELCIDPISVAEISARLRLHLGVTKILVADLRAAGYLDVHVTDTLSPLSSDTILRVMHGLRALS
ncbi:hypothetical protein Aph02nite_14630 [Actinoplanes philippinensis]|uniref:DUF742 domain-containing protein n=1 Tax=Actinoplanes philippinensis TaxID=35752 RepID=A0A1I1ZIN2_9ACTN|nr:DUF742 domain-containing protein [Actinoplanes philippinensis]GIE75513.1 hypothetical protein Aph02nite_14630 [Actinoplanes philippinensis]SFE30413.1 Protein of unknown function [Actinoplanes philippinensis]